MPRTAACGARRSAKQYDTENRLGKPARKTNLEKGTWKEKGAGK